MPEIEIKHTQGVFSGFKELWQYRELFFIFTWRDIKVKYKQTVLGFLWAVLQPLLMMTVFTVFFGKIINKNIPQELPYPVFVFAGLILWNVFSTGLINSGNSMVTNSNIIKKIYFPRLIIPVSSVIASVFDFLMSLVIYAVLLIYYQIPFQPLALVYIPVALVLTFFTTVGAGSFLAALSVKYRDFRYIIPFLVQFLLFVTPVIYPDTIAENYWSRLLIEINPMTGALHMIRCGILGTPINNSLVLLSVTSSFIFLFVGIFTFRKTETYFADIA